MNRPKDDIISALRSSKKCRILSYKSVVRKLEINGSWGSRYSYHPNVKQTGDERTPRQRVQSLWEWLLASSRHLKYKKGHSTKFVDGLK
ncbi:hypothetical protein NCCP2648_13780 [Lacticaseibacillus rhamnosus]|nr:hypothetical protein NCCP2648_13780 [Lacticaseibacillus rhamnosus]